MGKLELENHPDDAPAEKRTSRLGKLKIDSINPFRSTINVPQKPAQWGRMLVHVVKGKRVIISEELTVVDVTRVLKGRRTVVSVPFTQTSREGQEPDRQSGLPSPYKGDTALANREIDQRSDLNSAQRAARVRSRIALARSLRAERELNGPYSEEKVKELDEKLEQELIKRWTSR